MGSIPKVADICVHFFNMTFKVNEHNTHQTQLLGCTDLSLNLYNKTIGAFPVDCFQIPGDPNQVHKERRFNMMFNWMPWSNLCTRRGIVTSCPAGYRAQGEGVLTWCPSRCPDPVCAQELPRRGRLTWCVCAQVQEVWHDVQQDAVMHSGHKEKKVQHVKLDALMKVMCKVGKVNWCSAEGLDTVCAHWMKLTRMFNLLNFICWFHWGWTCASVYRGITWRSSGCVDTNTVWVEGVHVDVQVCAA